MRKDSKAKPFVLLGQKTSPGKKRRLFLTISESFSGHPIEIPVFVVHGAKQGKVMGFTGGVHGDELNGIEIVRSIIEDIDPMTLCGTVIGVPIINLPGFRQNTRYLPDRRDLNRLFPGNPSGSYGSRIAHNIFNEIISKMDFLVDIHTGSFKKENYPQVRGDFLNPVTLKIAQSLKILAIHHPGKEGTLRRSASDHGIASVTIEIGEPLRLQMPFIITGKAALKTLLRRFGMTGKKVSQKDPDYVFYTQSKWIRSPKGGVFKSLVRLGESVQKKQDLGEIIDVLTHKRKILHSPYEGKIIGMAWDQLVMPGFGIFHLTRKPLSVEDLNVKSRLTHIKPTVEDPEDFEGLF